MADNNKDLLVSAEIQFIDPIACDSTIGYTIKSESEYSNDKNVIPGRFLTAQVAISDCNRHIMWYFTNDEATSVEKIDKAIEILTKFKKAYLKAKKNPKFVHSKYPKEG